MRTFTIKTIATAVVASALLITSCKKAEKGDTGPAGANGTNGVVPTYTDGFIKGNVSGTRENGTAFNEAFEFKNYYSGPSGSLDSNNAASFDFMISRSNDVFGENSASITVNTTSKTASTGSITLNDFSFKKSLGTNKWFVFTTSASPTATITGLSYNTSTNLFTGTYSFTIPGFQNSTGNSASVNGSFQATMTQIYHLVKHTPTHSAQ
jgi:hypothetical protein